MQVFIPPKIRKLLIIVLIVLLVGIGASILWPRLFPPHESASILTPGDAEAASNAAKAFYTLDDSEGIDGWIARVCATATEKGCVAIRNFYAPAVQDMVAKNHIQTECTTRSVRLVSEKGDTRIWEVQVSLTHPWADLKAVSQDVYVEVSNTDGQWLMDRILFAQEAAYLKTPTP